MNILTNFTNTISSVIINIGDSINSAFAAIILSIIAALPNIIFWVLSTLGNLFLGLLFTILKWFLDLTPKVDISGFNVIFATITAPLSILYDLFPLTAVALYTATALWLAILFIVMPLVYINKYIVRRVLG